MVTEAPKEKARLLRSLHEDGVLVLPNAWDAASAVLFAGLGARAIASTSGGVAWSQGRPDGEHVARADMVSVVGRIAGAVTVPVTADVEAGYGPEPQDVIATVEAVLAAGAAGINLEDSEAAGGPLFSHDAQARRLRAASDAAAAAGVDDFVINARTDVFLFEIGDPGDRLDEVLRRADVYAEAGAGCLFVPGLLDLGALQQLTKAAPLPVNVMAGPGGPSVGDLAGVGVRRISVGTGLSQVAYTAAQHAARAVLEEGTFAGLEGALSFGEMDGLFTPAGA